jgi:pyruvyl transferase EpsO
MELRRRIGAVLDPILAGTRTVALVGYGDHGNVGDSAIWLGQLSYLRSRGIRVLPASAGIEGLAPRERARALRGCTILLGGGGDFGDLWEGPHGLREEVLEWCRDSRIVQLPQSIHFQRRATLGRTRDLLERHGNVTLLVRDRRSLALARHEFDVPAELCPDMAFFLDVPGTRFPVPGSWFPVPGSWPPAPGPELDIFWLCRTDQESRKRSVRATPGNLVRADWVQESVGFLGRLQRFLVRQRMLHPRRLEPASVLQLRVQKALALRRTRRGCRLLANSRVVITDRLHGHILCTMLGIPHFVLDNSYGKVRSFYETWTSGVEIARWCDSPGDAIERAQRQLRNGAGRSHRAG